MPSPCRYWQGAVDCPQALLNALSCGSAGPADVDTVARITVEESPADIVRDLEGGWVRLAVAGTTAVAWQNEIFAAAT